MTNSRGKVSKDNDAALLSLVVNSVTDYAIFILDASGYVASWNPGAQRIKGYDAEEIIGQHFSKFYPQESIDCNWPMHELKVAAEVGRFEDEGWRIRKDGSRFWANVVITALRNEEQQLLGFAKITRDLTARKTAEENARRLAEETAARHVAHEERERLKVTLESIGDAVISIDAESRITFMNQSAVHLLGSNSAYPRGQPLEEVFQIRDEGTRQQIENPATRALREGKSIGCSNYTLLIARDGSERPIDLHAAPILNERGEVSGCVLVFRDIAELQRAERQRNARLAVTHALTIAATAAEAILQSLTAVCENLRWDTGLLWGVNEDGTALVYQASLQMPKLERVDFVQANKCTAFERGEGLRGRVWETGNPAWILEVSVDTNFPRAVAASAEGLHSAFACPIFVKEKFLGVIEFFSRRVEQFDPGLLEMMGTVAGAIGQCLERHRAEEELRQQTASAAALVRVGSLLSQQLDLQSLVQTVTDEGTQLCGAQFGAFFYNVINERGEAYTLYTISGVAREAFERFPMPRNTAIFSPTFSGKGPVRIADVTADSRYGKSAPYHGMPEGHLPVKSYLAVPVVSRSGEVLGGLFFGHAEIGVFTAEHERLLIGIAGQAAAAIDNARLHQRTQAAAERLNLALSAADLGDWSWDAESDIATFSERGAEIFGISAGPQMTWTELQKLIHEEDRGRARDEVERVIAQREQYDIEYRVNRPDGSKVWVGVLGRAVYDSHGKVVGMHGVVQDISDRKRLHQSLKTSEARFRGLIEQAPFSVQVFSPQGHTIMVNRAWKELWGLTIDQLKSYNILEDQQLENNGVLQFLRKAFAGAPTFIPPAEYDPNKTLPGETRHKDAIRWVSAVAYPFKDEMGNVQEVVLVHDDITARRNTESALRDSEERLRLALEAGTMGVWDWNVCTGELKWSDSLEPLHGLAPGTFGGTFEHFEQLVHPEDRALLQSAIKTAIETREQFYVEFRNLRPNGGIHWIAGSGKVFEGSDGKPLRMIGVGMDVTNRRRSENTARFLADASAALSVLVDSDSTLQKVASLAVPHFADWVAVDVLEENGQLRRVAVAHVEPTKVKFAHELHRRFPADPSDSRGVWSILRTSKAELVPELTDEMLAESVKDPELLGIIRELGLKSYIGVPLIVRGKTIGVITFIMAESGHTYDETDLAVAEDLASRTGIAVENSQLYRELRDADHRKDEFLATLAHELRNPLAPIRNGLQVFRLAGARGEMAEDALTMMERQLSHMVRLVDDLLDVSRITRNKLELRKERVSLATVIHTGVETARPMIEHFGHTFSAKLPPKPVYIDADPLRLAQVFSNLLTNAAKYTEPGGQISLIATTVGEEAVVHVQDNGLGIPLEAQSSIFEMFSQVDRNIERSQGGLGIGLTLVRRLVEMHGGRVDVKSEGPGKGSEFTVRIPVQTEFRTIVGSELPSQSMVADTKQRILVVDDNVDAAESLSMMLKIMGNEVRTAADGQAAVEIADEYRPDVILLDIGMPKLNGYEACRRIRKQAWARDVVIIAQTGWGTDEDKAKSQKAGFDFHIIKPVDPAVLNELLKGLPSKNQKPANLKVLVVDDRRDAVYILAKLLEMLGYEVQTTTDSAAALGIVRTFLPHAIFLDIEMPGLNGFQVARLIRQDESLKRIAIIAMTGYEFEDGEKQFQEAGFDDHLVKPADIRKIKQALEMHCVKPTLNYKVLGCESTDYKC